MPELALRKSTSSRNNLAPGSADIELTLPFDNSYARELEGFFVPWRADPSPAPRLLKVNHALAHELGLNVDALGSAAGLAIFSGNQLPQGAEPIAQVYAGHQFGGYSPLLGDGRALLLGEIIDSQGHRRDIAFKGSGRTPFGTRGDGKAALGPVLREYLVGEAMHALGIPTTRALAVVRTGEIVWRERELPGALLTRIATSHIRVGTYQYFAARGEIEQVRRLADYTIARHAPELRTHATPYLALLNEVVTRQATLIARWMSIGFIHGVMNTDNMSVAGETIDYGPCAFLEAYDPATVFSSIDRQGRYAFGNQPVIAQWNLARFAETLLPLLHGSEDQTFQLATRAVEAFAPQYRAAWLALFRAKLGLCENEDEDQGLADDLLNLLHAQQADFTLGFRHLLAAQRGDDETFLTLFPDNCAAAQAWLERWRSRLQRSAASPAQREATLSRANPIYIPRNHLVEQALSAAVDDADLGPFDRLLQRVTQPFAEQADAAAFALPAPKEQTACYRTFCGT